MAPGRCARQQQAMAAARFLLSSNGNTAVGRSISNAMGGDSRRSFEDLGKRGCLDEALTAAEVMQQQGIPLSKRLAYRLLQECTKREDLECGRRVEALMVCSGIDSVSTFADHLVRLFASCGSLAEANQAFNRVAKPSAYTWSAIIAAHAKLGHGEMALELYDRMLLSGVKSDKYVYLAVLKACTASSGLNQGRLIHDQIIKSGLESDVVVGNALLDMYAKCGSLEESCNVFDKLPNRNVVSWSAMIAGYGRHGEGLLALDCFRNMQQEGIMPNKVTFLSILKACGSIGAIKQGRLIHDQIIESGLQSDIAVGNALVDMYAKCGSLEESHKVLDSLPHRDVVSWGALIAGYAQHGKDLLILDCFERMEQEDIKPSKVTFLSILKACGNVGAITQGRHVHEQIIESGFESDVVLGSALVDMYGKCSSLEEAGKVLDKLPYRDVVSWNALIAGYAQSGNFKLAVQCLNVMQQEGIKPDDVTFVGILAACGHVGLVDEGLKYFKSMKEDHGIMPHAYHYTCMVDLLGRAGRLNEADNLLQIIQSDFIGGTSLLPACRSLLTACRRHGNVELGRQCFDRVVQLDPHDASGYVLMSGIYSDALMWKDAEKVDELRQYARAWKKPAKAWIEVNNKVHEFIVGDKGHAHSEEIYAMLKTLSNRLKEEGYIPKIELVLQQMSNEEKEDALCGHAEKLAVAFGFSRAPAGTIIRVTKNLRMCMDCHNATKAISKIERQEIIIRDAYRMHHFKDGSCSCGGYY